MTKIVDFIKTIGIYKYLSLIKWSFKEVPFMFAALIFRIMPINRNKVVFSSYHGKQYNAQPKCISDDLLAKVRDNHQIVWILTENQNTPTTIRKSKPWSLRAIYDLMTASVWVDNCRKPYWMVKRKKQLYIQTWHGPVCLKAVEKDAVDTLLPYYVKSAIRDSKNADYIVAESKWRKNNIRNSFWYSGQIIEAQFKKLGIVDEDEANRRVRDFYKLSDEDKIVVYLPTFRKDESISHYLLKYDSLLSTLSEKYKGMWKIIVRLHPNIASKATQIVYNDCVLNGTIYPNSNDLISASDFVITDYSGCIFDGFRAKKKVILYAEDFDEYVSNDRNIYFELSNMPSPLVRNIDELLCTINEFNEEKYEVDRASFVNELGYYEEEASEICSNIVLNHLNGGKKN